MNEENRDQVSIPGDLWDLGLFISPEVEYAEFNPLEFRVYAHLCYRASTEMRACGSQQDMATACGMSVDSVGKTLKSLEKKGWLVREARTWEDKRRKSDGIKLLGVVEIVEEDDAQV